ncbi:protein of unknown function [Methanoculleus bourgensis]|nr:protein of unknown function [Methanoculleus bourgensis]
MEPCLFRHGKEKLAEVGETTTLASMEPCLFRHGKGLRRYKMAHRHAGLQWSHVFSDMVSWIRPSSRKNTHMLQWSHVFSDMVSGRISSTPT